jgi:superfamily II DNA or RNA helicase
MINLRPYQENLKTDIYNAWDAGYKNVMARSATGSGKTILMCAIVKECLEQNISTAMIVHRKELVQQISLTLAKFDIKHNIIASRKDVRGIIAAQRRLYGRQFYDPDSLVTVISVDTLIARYDLYKNWAKGVNQWFIDEAAHVLKENKWGKAAAYFENARGLGVTATPERLDRKGLGSHADGVFDTMVEGPPIRWFIDNGYLSKYKIVIPRSDYKNFLKEASDKSDFSKQAMKQASKKSQIVGDVVENYLKFAKGKQTIVFTTDIETAKDMQAKFIEAGIPAKELNGTTNDRERLEGILKFEEKKIKVLINVDLFDEGLDVPGIECVSMCRPTKSLGKVLQMQGRGLRVAEGKDHLIIIDHVGNIAGPNGHGLPCKKREWTLDRIKKTGQKINFLRICSDVMCNSPYDRALTECPWCGTEALKSSRTNGPSERVLPEQVDGDLFLIDPETLREIEEGAVLESPAHMAERVGHAAGAGAALRAMKNQNDRIETQGKLGEAIAKAAGVLKTHYGYSDRSIHKKFYICFGMTITEALGEKKVDMEKLIVKLENNEML